MKGFFKRLLIIDMNNQTSRAEPLDEELFRQYLGGKGLATHLLLKHNPPGVAL